MNSLELLRRRVVVAPTGFTRPVTPEDVLSMERDLRRLDDRLLGLVAPMAGHMALMKLHAAVVGALIQLSWLKEALGIREPLGELAENGPSQLPQGIDQGGGPEGSSQAA